jgi:hypothetical protein
MGFKPSTKRLKNNYKKAVRTYGKARILYDVIAKNYMMH